MMIYLRLGFTLIIAFLAVLVVFPFQWMAATARILPADVFASRYCRFVCRLLGIRVFRPSAADWPGAALIVPNHVSWMDILVLASLGQTQFLAKKEVGYWPIVGVLARLQGVIFVDRQRKRSIPAVNKAMANALASGHSVILFAEGTTNDGTRIEKFHSSHFQPVLQALQIVPEGTKVQIVPVALAYTRRHGLAMGRAGRAQIAWYGDMALMPHVIDLLRWGPVDCRVEIAAPFEAGVDSCRKELALAAQSRVRHLLAAVGR